MQERNLQFLIEDNGFQFSDTFFPYTSGQIGPYYVSSESVMSNGWHYKIACEDLSDLIEMEYPRKLVDVIAGGEKRDWIFSGPVAMCLEKAHVMICKDGTYIPAHANIKDKNVVLVCDLNNEGSSPRDKWVPVIRKAGGIIERIFLYVDRLEDGVGVMKELGLKSEAVVPLNEHAWDYLQKNGVIHETIYKNLRERMEDKDAWARRMLQSEAGAKRLAELYDDTKKREKVATIVYKGYPDMEEKLIEGLTHYSSSFKVHGIDELLGFKSTQGGSL